MTKLHITASSCALFMLLLPIGCGAAASDAPATVSGGTDSGTSGTAGSSGSGSGSGTSTGSGSGSGTTGSSRGKATVFTATRLLDQATFGPTQSDIAHVETVGIPAYLAEQYAVPTTAIPDIPNNPNPTQCTNNPAACWEGLVWANMMTAPDQLRQRVAFSLAEIFVVSTQSETGLLMPAYWNTLANDAFSNWRTIMEDVTLSPAMGNYLNMIQSNKPAAGQIANENYAREMLQLFATGLYALNQDGTLQLDASGKTIPAYTEAQVEAFARAYTGWTYATATGTAPTKFPNTTPNYDAPMQPVDANHDTTAKTLLNGTVLSAGGTARQDLKGALDNIFQSSYLPPFVCRQLIQHLVTSTPSAGYVQRVAGVFINNGKGVRGDMQAVLTAIFTDTEARAGDTDNTYGGGHLREPMLYLTGAMRSLSYANTNTDTTNPYSWMSLSGYTSPLGEQPLRSPSVFNFYPPEYVIPGTQLNAPEFSLENTASVNLRLTLANTLSTGKFSNYAADFSKTGTFGTLAATPGDLVDSLGVLLMHGQMPSTMRTQILSTLNTTTDQPTRVRLAVYLILSSSQYKVMH